jgi:uncharacterized phage protein (TIGR01671 family)
MREIKFREFIDGRMQTWNLDDLHEREGGYMGKVMQYTGFKDKNGKEIYEGDVVKVANVYNEVNFGDERTYQVIQVRWEGRGWYPFVVSGGIDCDYSYSTSDVQIIGNIWENPELIN